MKQKDCMAFPYPVHVGVVTTGGEHAQLHRYTLERNLTKMEKLLMKGVAVDCVNHLGQTPLFCAAFLGHVRMTELLLHYGADPNHRCEDWSTPVHAGVFSCNPSVVSSLLNAGGDLRLHDREGRTACEWLRAAKQDDSAKMKDLLQNCISSMQHLCWSTAVSGIDTQFSKRTSTKCSWPTHCFGFGKVCVNKSCQMLAVPASVPLITESELTQADNGPPLSFICGSLASMTNHSWRGSTVTVKMMRDTHTAYLDLLLVEQEYCSQLCHPQLLQLMAVSLSDDFQRTSLVFEPVNVGTLHNLLHNERAEVPVLRDKWLLSVILQVCEGLQYLHGRGLVMRALSSHSVVLTKLTVAKLTDLSFMVPSSENECVQPSMHIALPHSLYRWAAPEVIKQQPCTKEADIYSLCVLIHELYTNAELWVAVELDGIKQEEEAGQTLEADSSIPQPYYGVVLKGLQQYPQDRTCCLQTLCCTLRQDIQRCCIEEQQRGGLCAYSEQDLGPELKTTVQHTITGEPVQSVSLRKVRPGKVRSDTGVERQVHLDKRLHDLLYRAVKPELDRERAENVEEEPMLHQACPYKDVCSLLGDLDSSSEEEPETETDHDRETVEMLGTSKPSRVTIGHQISTIALNLKVSQELLQQASRSLDVVKRHLQLNHKEQVQLNPVTGHSIPCCTSSSSNVFTFSVAVGPPSKQYRPMEHRGASWAEKLEAQLLSRDWKLLAQEDLSLWLSHYPAEQEQKEQGRLLQPFLDGVMTKSYSGGADHSVNETSLYRSALEDNLHSILSEGRQQTSSVLQENADVTVGVCRPSATWNPLLSDHNTQYERFLDTFEEAYTDPGVPGKQAQYTPSTNVSPSDMNVLAEVSSIRQSPAQQHKNLSRMSMKRPFNSTPSSADALVAFTEARLSESPACSPVSSAYVRRESLTTSKETSIKVLNILQPSPFNIESSGEGFITASQEEGLFRGKVSFSTSFSSVDGENEVKPEEESEGFVKSEERQEEADKTTFQPRDEEENEHRVEECSKGEGRMGEEEGRGKHVQGASKEEEHVWCDPQRDVGSALVDEGNGENIKERSNKVIGLLGSINQADDTSCFGLTGHSGELAADPGKKKEDRVFPESLQSHSLLEDTNRAHSTLDDVLQNFIMESTRKSPGLNKEICTARDYEEHPVGESAQMVSPSDDKVTT